MLPKGKSRKMLIHFTNCLFIVSNLLLLYWKIDKFSHKSTNKLSTNKKWEIKYNLPPNKCLKFCYFKKMLYFAPNKLLSPMQTKEKYQLEVTVNASPQLIYQYISTPVGFALWYADDVRANEDTYTFV